MNKKLEATMPAWVLNQECLTLTQSALDSVGGIPLTVVDNASPVGGGYLRKMATTYVRNSENLGYARAVNQGIKLSEGKYLAIVSNDIVASPNWKEVCEKVFRDNPDAFSLHFRMTDYGVPFTYGSKIVPTGKERWCAAAFFVLDVEKALSHDLLFDEHFFNSFEDWDLFLRARAKGFKTVYTDMASFQHMHSFTQKLVGFTGTEKNREFFIRKHGEDPDLMFARLYPDQVAQDYMKGWEI